MPNQQNTARGQGPQRTGRPSGGRRPRRDDRQPEKREFDSKILDLARVTRVTAGGKRMRFRTCIVVGDRKGRVGVGVAKGADVQQSVSKATNRARKEMVRVPIVDGTIPHDVNVKFAAAKVLVKPAPTGTAIKAGGAVRVVLELAGIPNVVAKILGSNNKINNAKATMKALKELQGSTLTEAPASAFERKPSRRPPGRKPGGGPRGGNARQKAGTPGSGQANASGGQAAKK